MPCFSNRLPILSKKPYPFCVCNSGGKGKNLFQRAHGTTKTASATITNTAETTLKVPLNDFPPYLRLFISSVFRASERPRLQRVYSWSVQSALTWRQVLDGSDVTESNVTSQTSNGEKAGSWRDTHPSCVNPKWRSSCSS